MATIGNTVPTLVDVTTRLDPNGAIARIAEVLQKKNPILQDIPWIEGNLPTGHRYTSRSALPAVGYRRFNQGVASASSQTEQVDEECGILTGFSKVDCDLADLNGNAAAFRASEDQAFMQAFQQDVSQGLFYYSHQVTPDKWTGIGTRLNATAGNPAAAQIIKADASASGADQTSITLIGWSPDTVFGIYPKGSQAGIAHGDLGKQLVRDSNNLEYSAWVTEWKWKLGMCVKDYRYVARLCNIDTSNWKADLSAGADLTLGMVDLKMALYETATVNPVYYMNRAAFAMLSKQLLKKSNDPIIHIERGGQFIPTFQGIPIRITDAITSTESVVS